MELKKRTVKYYETVLEASVVHSESADMIVSDAYPDFDRVISAAGNAYIKDKTAQNGRVMISGVAKVTALCVAEGGTGVHRIDIPVQFVHIEEGSFVTQQSYVSVEASVRNIEPRMANPRKLSIRVNIMLKIVAYEISEKEICHDIASLDSEKLQILRKQYEATLAVHIKEKSFTIIEDVNIDSFANSADICGHRIVIESEETRIIKNKAVLKGNAAVRLTAFDQMDASFSALDIKLPFSQVLEMDGIDEECAVASSACIKNADFVMSGDQEAGTLSLQCMISVDLFAVAYAKQVISAVCDAYSTMYDTELETMPCAFSSPSQKRERVVDINEPIRLSSPASSVIDCTVSLDAPEYSGEPEAQLRSTAYISVLYKNTDGELTLGNATLPVSCFDAPMRRDLFDSTCECLSSHASAAAGGDIQIAMKVLFTNADKECVKVPYIRSVDLKKDRIKSRDQNLSLILTYVPREESLWGIAKRYNTTASEIASANGLSSDDSVVQGRMLLIPIER